MKPRMALKVDVNSELAEDANEEGPPTARFDREI